MTTKGKQTSGQPTTNTGREDAANGNKRIRRANRGNGEGTADFAGIDTALLCRAIASVTARGVSLQLGYTRDGGAYVFRYVGDGDEPYNEYVRPTEDVELYLRGVIEDFSL